MIRATGVKGVTGRRGTRRSAYATRQAGRVLATLAAAVIAVVGCGSGGTPSGGSIPKVIDVSIGSTSQSTSAIAFPLWTLLQQVPQFYSQVGLRVKVTSVQMGQAVQLTQSGSPPILEGTGLTSVAAGYKRGATKVKVFAGDLQTPAYELVTRPGVTDLKEIGTLGVPSIDSASSQNCQAILRSIGKRANSDYRLVLLGTSGARVAAVRAGKVDGSCELPPYVAVYHDQYGLPVVAKASDYLRYYWAGAWAFNEEWARDAVHRETVVRLAEANMLARVWARDPGNHSKVVGLIKSTFKVDDRYAESFYQQEIVGQTLSPDGYIPKEGAEGNTKDMVNLGLFKSPPNPSQYVDWSILQEAGRRLHITVRRPTY